MKLWEKATLEFEACETPLLSLGGAGNSEGAAMPWPSTSSVTRSRARCALRPAPRGRRATRDGRHPPSLFAAVSHQSPSPTLSDITKVLDLGQTIYIDIDPHLAHSYNATYTGTVHTKVHAILRLRFWATLDFGTFSAPLRLL